MALTDNLLKFASLASTNIQEAFGKQSKKRRVNVRKYAQKRVKRLDSACKAPKLAATTTTTKSKSARYNQRQVLTHVGSHSWPQLSSVSNQAPFVPQTAGVATSSQSTIELHFSCSEPSMYTTDPELDSLLTDIIELESSHSPTSRPASVSPTPSQPTLESQVFVAERPISPYSSCSEELLDSAYNSPLNNYSGCSPVPPVVPTSHSEWSFVSSPPTTLPPFSTSYNTWVEQPVSTGCTWMPPQNSTPAISTSVCNQVPPMTPTVSELLDQWSSCNF